MKKQERRSSRNWLEESDDEDDAITTRDNKHNDSFTSE
jgi:hypothetical protein